MHWRLNGKDTAAAQRNNMPGLTQSLLKRPLKTVLIGEWVFKCVVFQLV